MSFIKITPVGFDPEKVVSKIYLLPEESRPRWCPGHQNCRPVAKSFQTNQETMDKGYSGTCYGHCLTSFKVLDVDHVNDFCKCVMTGLKGVIRNFINYNDMGIDRGDLGRLMQMLRPRNCEECKRPTYDAPLTSWANGPTLCDGCAVRLGVIEFIPVNVGTGRAVYMSKHR